MRGEGQEAANGLAISEGERWRAFWAFQGIFWGANLAIRSFAALQGHPELLWGYMGPRVLAVLAGAAATTAIGVILARADHWATGQRLALAMGLGLIALVPMNVLENALVRIAAPSWPGAQFVEYVAQFGWVLMMWVGYYFAQDYAFRVRRQAAELARAQNAAHAAQLKMLRYQLNPHFLFNTLNAISTLVLDKRFAEAERMILSLAQFLRHTIDTDPGQLSPLGVESRIQRLYLEIEKARFGDRLRVSCVIDPKLEHCLVPSLLIQPLLENAIKYAVAPNPDGGKVAIGAFVRDENLVLYVSDDGPGLGAGAEARRGGVGLRNTRERLDAAFEGRASLRLDPNPDGKGLRVEITMPQVRPCQALNGAAG